MISQFDSSNLEVIYYARKYGIEITKTDIDEGFDYAKTDIHGNNMLTLCSLNKNGRLFEKIFSIQIQESQEEITDDKLWNQDGYHKFANDDTKELSYLYHKYGFEVSIKEVIEGFDTRKVNDNGNSLIYEIVKKVTPTQEMLTYKWNDFTSAIEHGVDVNYTARENKWTALHLSVSSYQPSFVENLIKAGAKIKVDKFGATQLDLINQQKTLVMQEKMQNCINDLKEDGYN